MPLPAMTFEQMLPRLVTAYDRGILVRVDPADAEEQEREAARNAGSHV